MHTILILDFETTGLNPYLNDIIEIAIKKMGYDDKFQTLVKPKRLPKGLITYIPPHITNITKITDTMIHNEAITKQKAIYNMLTFIDNICDGDGLIYLVSHNGTIFDFIIFRRMIQEYIHKSQFTRFKENLIKRIRYIDSVLLAKLFISDKEKVNQPALCKKYNIINESEHRAMGDVQALEKLYEHLCEECSKKYNEEEGNYMLENPEKIIEKLFV